MMERPLQPRMGGPKAAGGRRSYALESLAQALRVQEGLQILDLGGLNQSNLEFVTGLGHKLYAGDAVQAAERFFTPEEWRAPEIEHDRLRQFLDQTIELDDRSAHGALVWDGLQFLPAVLQDALLVRLRRVLVPGAPVLAFFHTTAGARQMTFRVLDGSELAMAPKAATRTAPAMNPRAVERLFKDFSALKFFLTKENIQEVIARR